ncbi:hypothetical protein GS601_10760 [Myxacorys almedinensis A]|uniref:Argininosuccinate lyase n=1 Tax=Myxacorys almedinensis A TaxID=2690445 RepID=A0A8J8CJM6_9CYAN|nr:hypothetical protein [Myxacorys almedinensis A]
MASIFAAPIAALSANSALAEDLVFMLRNTTSSPIVQFYVESTNASDWGEDILNSSIEPGETAEVTIADGKTTCIYGIKGVFADGSTTEEENLNLCELGSYTYTEK